MVSRPAVCTPARPAPQPNTTMIPLHSATLMRERLSRSRPFGALGRCIYQGLGGGRAPSPPLSRRPAPTRLYPNAATTSATTFILDQGAGALGICITRVTASPPPPSHSLPIHSQFLACTTLATSHRVIRPPAATMLASSRSANCACSTSSRAAGLPHTLPRVKAARNETCCNSSGLGLSLAVSSEAPALSLHAELKGILLMPALPRSLVQPSRGHVVAQAGKDGETDWDDAWKK